MIAKEINGIIFEEQKLVILKIEDKEKLEKRGDDNQVTFENDVEVHEKTVIVININKKENIDL